MDNVSAQLFILDGFSELGALRPWLFVPFFTLLVLSVSANCLLLYVVVSQRSLHSPMYVLIASMACVDLSLPLIFVPNMLLSFLLDWRGISLPGCLVQMFHVHFIGTFQSTVLVWMALDRYHAHMALPGFLRFVIPLVIRNIFLITLMVSLAGRLSFCASTVINHCFCEHMALVQLGCGDTTTNNLVGLLSVFLIPVVDFVCIASSYAVILSSVLRSGGPSLKALHTCVTHSAVMSVALTVALTAFLSYRIRNELPPSTHIFLSTMYLLFPSFFNPIIYGIGTTRIRQHMLKVMFGNLSKLQASDVS